MRDVSVLLLTLLAASLPTGVRAQPLSVGDAVPPLGIEEYVQGSAGEGADGFPLFIDFWATWCAPCVRQLPHFNALADEFGDRVQFVSVTTFEERGDVERFLETREIRGAVGVDSDHSLYDAFGVHTIPLTVLVGPDGRVAAITRAEDVDGDVLTRLVAGTLVAEPPAAPPPSVAGGDVASSVPLPPAPGPRVPSQVPEAYVVSVRALPLDLPGAGFSGMMPGFVDVWALPLRDVLGMAYGVSPGRVLGPDSSLAQRYQVVVKLPEGERDRFDDVLRGALASATGLRSRLERRAVAAYVLRAPDGPGRLHESAPGADYRMSTTPGISAARSNPIGNLVWYLETRLGVPVVDETGLTGRYDWTFEHPEGADALREAVSARLGLLLEPTEAELEVVVTSPEG